MLDSQISDSWSKPETTKLTHGPHGKWYRWCMRNCIKRKKWYNRVPQGGIYRQFIEYISPVWLTAVGNKGGCWAIRFRFLKNNCCSKSCCWANALISKLGSNGMGTGGWGGNRKGYCPTSDWFLIALCNRLDAGDALFVDGSDASLIPIVE